MAFPMTTPMRPVPGAYVNTPATVRHGQGQGQTRDPVRRRLDFGRDAAAAASTPHRASSSAAMTNTPSSGLQQQIAPSEAPLPPILKGARTVNYALQQDDSYPDLDSCCRPGASSDYDFQSPDSPSAPFRKERVYDIPQAILHKIDSGHVHTRLGLFAEINHAWVTIDNCLFLWDYTNPEADLVGYEESAYHISAVALVPPKKGVFVEAITHLLVIATGSEIGLLGVSATPTPAGPKTITLFQTRLGTSRGGADVSIIRGSELGRIFFGGDSDTDVYELYYQQEEKWFSSRCGKINHSRPGWTSVVATMPALDLFRGGRHDGLVDMVIDDTRNLVYTLSAKSTIRTYHMDGPDKLTQVIEKDKTHCLRDVAHMVDRTPLLNDRMAIVALSPISAREASKLHLMALTSTGCRLFLSATSSASYMMGASSSAGTAPQSMQVQFIKFPPRADGGSGRRAGPFGDVGIDASSTDLDASVFGKRFAPGYFFDVVRGRHTGDADCLFVSAPDSGRIKNITPASALRYYEHCNWVDLEGPPGARIIAVEPLGPPFAASRQPLGFGNELAVQFDRPPGEFVVLTNNGVYVVRRRRLVDTFATAIRAAPGGDDAVDAVTRRFFAHYGRLETIAAALAVACGQGGDLRTGTGRAADKETEDRATTAFLLFGGQPTVEADGAVTATADALRLSDAVRLSVRHDALGLYLTRLVRPLWKTRVATLGVQPAAGGVTVQSTVPAATLAAVQENLERLRRFLEAHKASIRGLSGPPSDLQHAAASKQDEVALQVEHQALHGLRKLMESVSEGISFALMLFDERVADMYMELEDGAKQQFRDLTFESLFSQQAGKELAKLLVKAIVNRNIQNGSNVETVADALRRRCGSFCSPDDVVVFKAQEQLQRATEQAAHPTQLRALLNESLRLFERVAGSLTHHNLRLAVEQYTALAYYAGAIRLCLAVAREKDRGNKALAWINEGRPAHDPRARALDKRKRCYDLVHEVLATLDAASGAEPDVVDGRPTLAATKRAEAYGVVNDSDDEVFHFDLYEWYLSQNWTDRILATESPHVVAFLQRLAATDARHADLLCRFYTHRSRYFEAARVEADLAQSEFAIGIKHRITLLSRAKGHASVSTLGVGRQQQQLLNHEVAELLEIAHIQDDLLERLQADARIPEDRKAEIQQALDGPVRTLTELFNDYADQAGYYDLCLLIYHAADFHNPRVIAETWESLISQTHYDVEERRQAWEKARRGGRRRSQGGAGSGRLDDEDDDEVPPPQPYEMVSAQVESIAHRTSLDSMVFPIDTLVGLLCRYAVTQGQDATVGADPAWPVAVFLQLGVAHALVARALERMLDAQETPFTGRRRRMVCRWIAAVAGAWAREAERAGGEAAPGAWVADLLGRCDECLGQMAAAATGRAGPAGEVEETVAVQREVRGLKAAVEAMAMKVGGDGSLFR